MHKNQIINNKRMTDKTTLLELGVAVIKQEADALFLLAKSLEKDLREVFYNAIILIETINNNGRVIITGMGKSGHIARKFAATLSSTGTPALFIHPGEASHGDLGMMMPDDILVALSNSGETNELVDIVHYCNRHKTPLLSITQDGTSALAKNSSVSLTIPKVPEACPNNLAPTTSTSLMLALCDALAVVILQRKNFSAVDFHRFHPGGKLGQKLKPVSNVMKKDDDLPLVACNASMEDAVICMTSKRLGCVGVIDNNKLIGLITDGDLRRALKLQNVATALSKKSAVASYMTKDPITIKLDTLVGTALSIMSEHKITVLFVVNDNSNPVGVVHIHDLLS